MLWYVLKQLNDFEIIAYKEPSTIREVDFKRIVEELYEANISDEAMEDTAVKK